MIGRASAGILYLLVFFFKQKTAYEISLGLVGSEMCIRDRTTRVSNPRMKDKARDLKEMVMAKMKEKNK